MSQNSNVVKPKNSGFGQYIRKNTASKNFLPVQNSASTSSLPPLPPQTPYGNTGSQSPVSLTVGIDFLTGTGRFIPGEEFPLGGALSHVSSQEKISVLIRLLTESFSEELVHYPGEGRLFGTYFASRFQSPGGIQVAYNLYEDGSLYYYLSIPGSILRSVPYSVLNGVLRGLVLSYKFAVTRIDIALDDYARSVSLSTVEEAARQGSYRRLRRHRIESHGTPDYSKGGVTDTGNTVYFGSRQSEKYLRIYDKGLQSKGVQDCIRWELEAKDGIAKQIVSSLIDINEDYEVHSHFLAGTVVGAIEFVQPASRQLARCPRLDWWEKFVSRVGCSVFLAGVSDKPTLQRKVQWLHHIAPTLAVVRKVYDSFSQADGVSGFFKLLDGILRNGEERLNRGHYALINTALGKPVYSPLASNC